MARLLSMRCPLSLPATLLEVRGARRPMVYNSFAPFAAHCASQAEMHNDFANRSLCQKNR
eukprot:2396705-Pyramimonas_sp.AAC.1